MNSNKSMKEFNLNAKIKAKIKDEGYTHWKNKRNKYLSEDLKCSVSEMKEKEDEDGYVTFQACDFMRIFGETIDLGFNAMFETSILIEEEDLKDNDQTSNSMVSLRGRNVEIQSL